MSQAARIPDPAPAGPRSFLKWAGGKQALAPGLLQHFPARHPSGRYLEPFLGGGSLLLRWAPPRAVVADANAWLIDTWRAVQSDWRAVAAALERLPNTKDDYLRIRARDPQSLSLAERAAQFIYLNKTGFRGLFRVNRMGVFNVPYGAYDRRYYDPDNLAAVARAVAPVEFRVDDFEALLGEATAQDFVYLDPPYYKLGGHADFNRYTPGQFREDDHHRLAACCQDLARRGVPFAQSNSDTPFIRELYRDYELIEIDARREIHLSSGKRAIRELLIRSPAGDTRSRKS